MDKQNKCLICNSENTEIFKTKVSGFLTLRMLDGQEKFINFIHCKDCGFAYYDYRPDDVEMKKLYCGYRNEKYQKQRQAFDCWYSEELNELIGKNEVEKKSRENNLSSILKSNINIEKIRSVLDYGGDKGQHIPELFKNCKKFCYEISGVESIDGVIQLTDIREVEKQKYDFIMCNHVLEHVCNPLEIMFNISNLLKKGGYCYLELPFDNPFYGAKSDLFQFLFNKYFPIRALFFTFVQKFLSKYPYQMNEHINYYTQNSLEVILKQVGFEILFNEVRRIDCKWCKSKVLSVLAKRN